MDWLIFGGVVVVLALLGVLAQRKGWIDLSSKSRGPGRGMGGAGMMAVDEVFHPAAYEAHVEQDRQTSMPAPAPVPGDGDKDVYKGNVTIRL